MPKSPIPMSPAVNHYYSSGSQISDMRHSSRAQVTATQVGSHTLRVTGTYSLCGRVLRGSKYLSLASRQSVQRAAFQDPLEKRKVLRHCDLRGDDEANTICGEKGENIVEWNENLDTL
jgi:hypothetical protein